MSKDRSQNPHFSGTPTHRAWAAGYTAALSDAAGINPQPKQPLGIPKMMFPR